MFRSTTRRLAALAVTAVAATTVAPAAAAAQSAPAPTITDTVIAVSGADGFDPHTYFYDSGEEVVVFDAQFTPALAEQMLADIRATTDSPIRYPLPTPIFRWCMRTLRCCKPRSHTMRHRKRRRRQRWA